MRKLLSMLCVLALILSLGACTDPEEPAGTTAAPDAAAGVYDAYTPYDETVTLTTGTTVLGVGGLPSGDDYENNVFTRYLQKTQNVQMKVAWSVDNNTYASKVALCIAGKDLPDVLVVNRSTFRQMAENDLLADLSQVYEDCISDFLRAQLDSYGPELLEEVTVDGKLLGIPSPALNSCQNVLWIRSDWLEKAGLDAPKTLEDIEKTARKFMELKLGGENTIGLTTTSKLYGGYNSSWGLDSVFSLFGAYPGSWLVVDGQAAYGSVQPEEGSAGDPAPLVQRGHSGPGIRRAGRGQPSVPDRKRPLRNVFRRVVALQRRGGCGRTGSQCRLDRCGGPAGCRRQTQVCRPGPYPENRRGQQKLRPSGGGHQGSERRI